MTGVTVAIAAINPTDTHQGVFFWSTVVINIVYLRTFNVLPRLRVSTLGFWEANTKYQSSYWVIFDWERVERPGLSVGYIFLKRQVYVTFLFYLVNWRNTYCIFVACKLCCLSRRRHCVLSVNAQWHAVAWRTSCSLCSHAKTGYWFSSVLCFSSNCF